MQDSQGDTEGQFDCLGVWGCRVECEVEFEPAQFGVGMGADAGGDSGTVGAHVGVEDREGVSDGGRGAGGDADRAEDVDVLSYCELAAEVGHVEDGGGVFDRGDGVAQRDESIAMSEVVGVEVGQCQHGIRVATIGGDQRGEAGQRRPPDQMHVHYSQ